MSIDWKYWGDCITNNKASILAIGGLIVSSGVKTLPLPGCTWDIKTTYTWLYDWSHQFLNVTNTRLSTAVVPTPPEPAPVNPTKAAPTA
jgi:hypothetical protein